MINAFQPGITPIAAWLAGGIDLTVASADKPSGYKALNSPDPLGPAKQRRMRWQMNMQRSGPRFEAQFFAT